MRQLANHRKILSALLMGFFVFAHQSSYAQYFELTEPCAKAYRNIISLKLEEGAAQLKVELKKHPDNLIPVYLENYIDFLKIYASDTRTIYDELKKNKEIRLVLLNQGDPSSPYYLFTQAEVNIQWAATEIKFGDYLTAIFDIRKAFKALEENQKKFPDFKPTKKSLGVLYALIGSVPDKYKWGVKLLGLDGNIDKGITYLKNLVEYGKTHDFLYQDETIIYYTFLLFHLQNQPDAAWATLKENAFPKPDNLMSLYCCAHIGVYGNQNEEALRLLSVKTDYSGFEKFPLISYLTGLAKLHTLDVEAEKNFKDFIYFYKGENHIKSTYQKLAWISLLRGDTVNYFENISKAENLGASMVEADKQAKQEAEANKVPNIHLLKARLLFDGGYYQKAADGMRQIATGNFTTEEEKAEYLYRFARIYDGWKKEDSALFFYAKAIEIGKNVPRYFAPNAALESGRIYEAKGEKEKARTYYELCLSFETHEYKNGLDQKAKAGLNRLK